MPRLLSTLLPKERAIPKTATKREADFWRQMKTGMEKTKRNIKATRLETWAMPGVPDVVLLDEFGQFHFVELKATAGNAVDLRPHQVAWLTNHGHGSVWVMVKKHKTKNLPEQFFLYKGADAVDLKMEGLKVDPYHHVEGRVDWSEIFSLICPTTSHIIP